MNNFMLAAIEEALKRKPPPLIETAPLLVGGLSIKSNGFVSFVFQS